MRGCAGTTARRRSGLVRKALPAGLVDAAFASLATFFVGLFAARVLSLPLLGVYAVFFTAYITAPVVPTQLLFLPAEINVLAGPLASRPRVLRQTLLPGTILAVLAGVVALSAALVGMRNADPQALIALAATAGVTTVVSPLQDHVRRVLHLSTMSYRAAAVSVIHAAVTGAAVLGLVTADVPAPWIPFGALAVGNAVSTLVGIGLARATDSQPLPRLQRWHLLQAGRWLVVLGLLPPAAQFASNIIVHVLAGPATLGQFEAARVAAQPLFVMMNGLSAVLSPRLLEGGVRQRGDMARSAFVLFEFLLIAVGVAYLLVAAVEWPLNPVAYLLPRAYEVKGLLAVAIVGATLTGLAQPSRAELIGAGKARRLTMLEGVANALQCAAAATAPVTGAFSRAAGTVAAGLVSWVTFRRERKRLHRSQQSTSGG